MESRVSSSVAEKILKSLRVILRYIAHATGYGMRSQIPHTNYQSEVRSRAVYYVIQHRHVYWYNTWYQVYDTARTWDAERWVAVSAMMIPRTEWITQTKYKEAFWILWVKPKRLFLNSEKKITFLSRSRLCQRKTCQLVSFSLGQPPRHRRYQTKKSDESDLAGSLIGGSASLAMATARGTGFFLANALGFVATSAVAYFCTAAAGLRLKPRSHPDDFEDGCDLWLHHCAASSSDGTFTWAKEKLCTMAAPASCAQHFDSKQRSPSLQGNIKSKRGLSLAPGGRITKSAIIAGSMSATDKLQLPSGLVVSPVWALVGCNSLAWASVYIMCVAAKKARARRSRQARSLRVNAAAGGGGVSMAVGDATGVADTAACGGAGNARVGPLREDNAPSAEVAQQAPMAWGSLHVAALSPGLVSPPKLRREKLVGGMSAARSSMSSSSSSKVLSGSEDTMVPCSNMVSAEDIGGLCRKINPRGSKLGLPAPAAVLPRSRSAPSVFTSLGVQASNHDNRKQVGAAEDPSRNDTATAHLGMRFLEAQLELQNMLGGGPRDGSASAISSVANPEVYCTHSGSPVPDSIGSEFSATDEPGSQPRASAASVSDVPSLDVQAAYAAFLDTPSTPSTTYSACWNVLGEGYAKSTSLHGISDLEIDVPSSSGSGEMVTQDTDCVIGGTPDGEMSTHDMLEPETGESKGVSIGRRTSWVEPPTGSPVGATVKDPGVGGIQFEGFDTTRSRLSGLRGGVEEAKGPFAFEISRSGKYQQLGPHACSDVIGEGVAEAKGDSACAELSAGVGPEVRAHALSDGIQGDVAGCEWDGPSDRLPPPSDYEVQEVARLNGILNEALRVLGSDE